MDKSYPGEEPLLVVRTSQKKRDLLVARKAFFVGSVKTGVVILCGSDALVAIDLYEML